MINLKDFTITILKVNNQMIFKTHKKRASAPIQKIVLNSL